MKEDIGGINYFNMNKQHLYFTIGVSCIVAFFFLWVGILIGRSYQQDINTKNNNQSLKKPLCDPSILYSIYYKRQFEKSMNRLDSVIRTVSNKK